MKLQDLVRFELTVICTGEVNDLLPGQIRQILCERFCLKHSEFSISDECRRCKVQSPSCSLPHWKPTTKKMEMIRRKSRICLPISGRPTDISAVYKATVVQLADCLELTYIWNFKRHDMEFEVI